MRKRPLLTTCKDLSIKESGDPGRGVPAAGYIYPESGVPAAGYINLESDISPNPQPLTPNPNPNPSPYFISNAFSITFFRSTSSMRSSSTGKFFRIVSVTFERLGRETRKRYVTGSICSKCRSFTRCAISAICASLSPERKRRMP